jgi:hypothetical protein
MLRRADLTAQTDRFDPGLIPALLKHLQCCQDSRFLNDLGPLKRSTILGIAASLRVCRVLCPLRFSSPSRFYEAKLSKKDAHYSCGRHVPLLRVSFCVSSFAARFSWRPTVLAMLTTARAMVESTLWPLYFMVISSSLLAVIRLARGLFFSPKELRAIAKLANGNVIYTAAVWLALMDSHFGAYILQSTRIFSSMMCGCGR